MKKNRWFKRDILQMALLAMMFLTIILTYSIISYTNQKRYAYQQFNNVSARISSSLETKLENTDFSFSTYFMNEDFQNAATHSQDQEASLEIEKTMNLLMASNSSELKGAGFIPLINGEYSTSDIIYDGVDYSILNHNMPRILEMAKRNEYQRGKLIFLKAQHFLDQQDSDYFVFARNINSVQSYNFNTKLGLGILYIHRSMVINILNNFENISYFHAIVNDSNGMVYSSDMDQDFSIYHGRRYIKRTISLDFLDWSLTVYMDSHMIFNELIRTYLIITLVIILVITFFGISIYRIRKKNRMALQYLFDNFSMIKDQNSLSTIALIGDKEVDRVISSYNELVESITKLNEQIIIEKNSRLQLQLDNMAYELNSLYSQINKHFLINVLSSIRSLVNLKDLEKAKYCIENLSEFLRYSLTIETSSTIEKEIDAVTSFLNIQMIRYPEVRYTLEVDEELNQVVVPKVLLQPIVENCFVHGFVDKKGMIHIHVYQKDNQAIIDVVNENETQLKDEDIVRINQQILSDIICEVNRKKGHGVALKNIQKRLQIFYEKKAGLEMLLSRNQDAVIIRIQIPLGVKPNV